MSPAPGRGTAQSFLVEHYRPGITPDTFRATMGRIRASAVAMRRDGSAIRCLHATFVPEDEAMRSVIEKIEAFRAQHTSKQDHRHRRRLDMDKLRRVIDSNHDGEADLSCSQPDNS